MWVNVVSTRSDDNKYKLNLGVALGIREYDDRFEVYYAGDNDPYKVKKTPEMVEAYNSLVPEKVQPVVPAEPDPTEWVTYMDAGGTQYRIQGRRMPPMEVEPEWVVQDKVPYRHGIDQRRWVIASTGETHLGYEWGPADCETWYSHGEFLDNLRTIQVHLRCRPDQLPKLDEVQP